MFFKIIIVVFFIFLVFILVVFVDEIFVCQVLVEIVFIIVIGYVFVDVWDNYCFVFIFYGYIVCNVWNGQEYGQIIFFIFIYFVVLVGKQCWFDFYYVQFSWIFNINGI